MNYLTCLILTCAWTLISAFNVIKTEKPCASRAVKGESVLCVCNTTYCDEVTREPAVDGRYVAYTSSKAGLRFLKTSFQLQSKANASLSRSEILLKIYPESTHQTVEGFGGAVTDAAGINWRSLPDALQSSLIDSYFSDKGLQYNMIRVPIGGTDFSTRAYAYNELPENDVKLNNFTLTDDDYKFKIPMIKASKQASTVPIHIVATTWSPPKWMKTSNAYGGFSRLKPQYYQTYADYHYKFLEKYATEDIFVWAITTTNEPTNGVFPVNRFNSLGWTCQHMGQWIVENLGPTIRNSTFKDVKILIGDDQRITIPLWVNKMINEHPKVLDYMDGVAVHYYTDFLAPASFLSNVPKDYPGKFVLATEACEGSFPWQKKVELGSWKRAKSYIEDIITDLNHDVVGWIDWNLCLDAKGGPNWAKNNVDSPIIVLPESKEFVKQPMFYAMGHFSKFIPRGSKRVKVEETKSILSSGISNVAFLTPMNTVVVVVYNDGKSRMLGIQLQDGDVALLQLPDNSVTTVELPYHPDPNSI